MTCKIDPPEKKKYISAVGEGLVREYGKQKFYKPDQVRRISRQLGYALDWECWAYCIFSSFEDFKVIHEAAGEVCDYAAMKTQTVAELMEGHPLDWFQLDLSWMEWPEIDLSMVFDWFDLS